MTQRTLRPENNKITPHGIYVDPEDSKIEEPPKKLHIPQIARLRENGAMTRTMDRRTIKKVERKTVEYPHN